jgi:hypothetical protein
MAAKFFLGHEATGTTGIGGDVHSVFGPFIAGFTGYITSVRVYSTGNGNIKTNLYGDVSGAPVGRLWYDDTGASVTAGGWTTITLATPVYVTVGSSYWIGGDGSASGVLSRPGTGTQYTKLYKSATYSTFTAPVTISGYTTQTNWTSICAYGVVPPTITDVGTDEIFGMDDAGIVITGTDFMAAGTTVWMADAPTWGAATIKVRQAVTAQADTSITFTHTRGVLPAGPAWVFVQTSLGQINAVGVPVIRLDTPLIAKIQIFRKCLTATEIKSLYGRVMRP